MLISNKSLRDYERVKNDILPELRQLLRVDVSRADQRKIIDLLCQLKSLCMLPSLTQPNKQNQIMLDNFGMTDLLEHNALLYVIGVVSDIMSFLLDKGTTGQTQLAIASPGQFN